MSFQQALQLEAMLGEKMFSFLPRERPRELDPKFAR